MTYIEVLAMICMTVVTVFVTVGTIAALILLGVYVWETFN